MTPSTPAWPPLGWRANRDSTRPVCACCGWARVGLCAPWRGPADAEAATTAQYRCVICGGQSFGLVAARRAEYFPLVRYTCPRCGAAYTGPRATGTPCPACGFAPPPAADAELAAAWLEVMTAALGRAYGPAVVAAWLDCSVAALAAPLAALTHWWFEEIAP